MSGGGHCCRFHVLGLCSPGTGFEALYSIYKITGTSGSPSNLTKRGPCPSGMASSFCSLPVFSKGDSSGRARPAHHLEPPGHRSPCPRQEVRPHPGSLVRSRPHHHEGSPALFRGGSGVRVSITGVPLPGFRPRLSCPPFALMMGLLG